MKKILFVFAVLVLVSCADSSQKTDNQKEESETKIEINTDSTDVKIGEGGISIEGNDQKDPVNIKINSKDGIKIEGKNGKVEINTGDSGGLKIEKKGKNLNIQIKEN